MINASDNQSSNKYRKLFENFILICAIGLTLCSIPLLSFGTYYSKKECDNYIKINADVLNVSCTIYPNDNTYFCDMNVTYVLLNSTNIQSNIMLSLVSEVKENQKILLYYSKMNVLKLSAEKCGDIIIYENITMVGAILLASSPLMLILYIFVYSVHYVARYVLKKK